MSACCCDLFQLDGSCMKEDEVIATCSGLLNSASARCINVFTEESVVYWIQY